MTNKGLKIQTRLGHGLGNSVFMSLNCHRRSSGNDTLGIYLVPTGGEVFARDLPHELPSVEGSDISKPESIYIMRHVKDVRYL